MPIQPFLTPMDRAEGPAPVVVAIPDPFLRMYVAQVLENRSLPTVEISSAANALAFLEQNEDTRIVIVDPSADETDHSFWCRAKGSVRKLAVLAVSLGGRVEAQACNSRGYDGAVDARSPNDVISKVRSLIAASHKPSSDDGVRTLAAGTR
jgi:CheY-like chemotaxis protein